MQYLRAHWQVLLVQACSLLLIWGIAAFAYGTLDVWARNRTALALQKELADALPSLKPWLADPFRPLDVLGEDRTLKDALELPMGMAAPATLRALTNAAYTVGEPNLSLINMVDGFTLRPPGAAQLPADVLARLQRLKGPPMILVAAGMRSGVLYYARRIPSSPSSALYAVRAVTIRSMEARFPAASLGSLAPTRLALELPHTAGTARWTPALKTKLAPLDSLTPPLGSAPQGRINAPNWPKTAFTIDATGEPNAGTLAKTLVFLWALCASAAVLWNYMAPLHRRTAATLAPFRQRLRALLPSAKAKDADARDDPLVQGPGTFNPADFQARLALQAKLRRQAPADPDDLSNLRKASPSAGMMAAKTLGTPDATEPSAAPSSASAADTGPRHARDASASPAPPPKPDTSGPSDEEKQKDLLERVQRCLTMNMLELSYQAIYETTSGAVFAHEVLARLKDDIGTIMPGEFMPLLPQLGGESQLDAAVFRHVIEQHCSAFKQPPTPLSLNVSGNSLDDLDYLRHLVSRGPDVLRHIILEVRSQEIVRDPSALQLLKALQRQGARVAVDYFGGGPIMVEATKSLGLDFVKIDCTRLSKTPAVKKEMVQLCMTAQKVKLPIIMEKVEDKAMETFVRRAGATYLQGYGLNRPQPQMTMIPLNAKM